MLSRKKLSLLIACSALLITAATVTTFAFRKEASNSLTNTFKVAENIDTDVEEPDIKYENTDIIKKPSVKNNSAIPVLVRVRVVASPESVLENIEFNSTNWIGGEDGFYYYNDVLKSKDATTSVFDKISNVIRCYAPDGEEKKCSFSDPMLSSLEVTIYEEAIPVTISDGETTYSALDKNENYNHTKALEVWEAAERIKLTK